MLALEQRITDLKIQAIEELDSGRLVGAHPITRAIAGLESYAWGIRDAIHRFPTEGDARKEIQSDLL